MPENVDAIPETVDFYSHLTPFVQFYKDFRIKTCYFQLFFVFYTRYAQWRRMNQGDGGTGTIDTCWVG